VHWRPSARANLASVVQALAPMPALELANGGARQPRLAEYDGIPIAVLMPAPAHSLDGGVDDAIGTNLQQRKRFTRSDGFKPWIDPTAQAAFGPLRAIQDRLEPARFEIGDVEHDPLYHTENKGTLVS